MNQMNNFITMLMQAEKSFEKKRNSTGDLWIISVDSGVFAYFDMNGNLKYLTPVEL